MKVILKRDVKGLGHEGDLKEVKDGYARNHLLPTGAAAVGDKGALANVLQMIVFVSFDVERYWKLIRFLAIAALVHGAILLWIDLFHDRI